MAYRLILLNNWDCNVDKPKGKALTKGQIREITKLVAKAKAIDSDENGVMYELSN